MEDEIYELLDDIMEISHQITEYFIEIIKSDIAGTKIKEKGDKEGKKRDIGLDDIENNRIFIELFKRLQEKYRKIEKNTSSITEKEIEEDEEEVVLTIPGELPKVSKLEFSAIMFNDLREYIEKSYMYMRFIDQIDDNGELIRESIYSNDLFKNIHKIEYLLQLSILDNIQTRLKFRQEKTKLNFEEKALVLEDLAQKIYYREFAMKHMKTYIDQFTKAKDFIDEEKYKEMYAHLYEQKYILIYEYMQHKYNGIIQEDDIGKFAMIKKFIDDDSISPLFNLSDSDIKLNVSGVIEECTKRLQKIVYDIEGSKEEKEDEEEKKESSDVVNKQHKDKKTDITSKNEVKNEEKSFDEEK